MKCEICGQGLTNGVSLYRTVPKGQVGPWRCEVHLTTKNKPDAETVELVSIIESANGVKQ